MVGKDELVGRVGFLVAVDAGLGAGECAGGAGRQKQYGELGGQGGLGVEAEYKGRFFAAVDGGPVGGFEGLRPGVSGGREDGEGVGIEEVPVDIDAMTAP